MIDEHERVGQPTHARGPVMQTHGGRWFYPLDPQPEDVFIDDIAAALSKICRYNGHCRRFYSVAQHSDMVSRLVEPEHARWGLMHDASETYLGDVTRPLKIAFEEFAPGLLKAMEENIHRAIAEKFCLPWPMPEEVKRADNVALATERRDLMDLGLDWGPLPEPHPGLIVTLDPSAARRAFERRFVELFDA